MIHKHVHVLYFQAKKDGHSVLKSVGKFGLEDLFRHFFENETYPGIVCYNMVQVKMYLIRCSFTCHTVFTESLASVVSPVSVAPPVSLSKLCSSDHDSP